LLARALTIAIVAAGLLLPASAGAVFSPPALGPVAGCGDDALPAASAAALDAARTSLLCAVNTERAARGLKPLRMNWRLSTAAQAHTQDMVSHRSFSHVGSDGSRVAARALRAGYVPQGRRWAIGEAIGWQWYGEGSPVRIIPHVLQSHLHYAQLMNPQYTDAGVGYLASPPDTTGYPGATCTVVVGRIFSR